jgi:hypothetical protein
MDKLEYTCRLDMWLNDRWTIQRWYKSIKQGLDGLQEHQQRDSSHLYRLVIQ